MSLINVEEFMALPQKWVVIHKESDEHIYYADAIEDDVLDSVMALPDGDLANYEIYVRVI